MFKFPVSLGDFKKLIVNNVGHGVFTSKDFGFCCLRVKSFQDNYLNYLKYVSLLSLKLKRYERKGKPSLINID